MNSLIILQKLNPRMYNKYEQLVIKIQKLYNNNYLGEGRAFALLMQNLDTVKWILDSISDYNSKIEIFNYFYTAYKIDGNKYHKNFNQFFSFISKYNLYKDVKNSSKLLFRVMTNEEYSIFMKEGNKNPCWSDSYNAIDKFGYLKILTKECRKSILVGAIYSNTDIVCFDCNDNEREYVIKRNANPLLTFRLFDYHYTYVSKFLGIGNINVSIRPNESKNGFKWVDALRDKGVTITKCNILANSFVEIVERRIKNYV